MPQDSKQTDVTLFKQLSNDSEKALDALIKKYKFALIHYIRRFVKRDELIKEVFMDTMQTVWMQRREMANKKDPVAWMIRIAHNKALNKTRDEQQPLTIPLENIPYPATVSGNGEAALEAKELELLLQKAAEKLSPQEKLVFLLYKNEGLDKKEIAAKCKVSENTVRNQLSSSIKKMNRFLSSIPKSILV